MHRGFSAPLLALSLALAACEHPTAPQARDAIEQTAEKMSSGDYMQLQSGMSQLFEMAAYYAEPAGGGRYVPAAPVSVVRNAAYEGYHATIVERVYLPPKGSPARPFSRFMLVAWSEPDENHLRRLVAVFTNDSVSDIAVPPPGAVNAQSPGLTARPVAHVVAANQADRRGWFGTDGKLVIRPGNRTGDCPYAGDKRGYSAIAELQYDSTAKLVCEQRSYLASLASFIERGDPTQRDLLSRIAPARETLRMEEATVPGVRIVTQCTGKRPILDDPVSCYARWFFWRNDDQFAPELGVHLADMQFMGGSDYLKQVVDTGTGPDYLNERGGYDMPVAYTLRAWDGTLLRESARTTMMTDSILRNFPVSFPERVGARYRIVSVPPIAGLPPMSVTVLDLAFLPLDK